MEPGKYVVKLAEWKLGYSPNKGTEQIGLVLEVVSGECKGEKIVAYKYFSDGAFPWTIKALSALGWDGEDFDTFKGLGTTTAEAEIETETQEGKRRLKVSWINPIGVAMSEEMSTHKRKSFAERMRAMKSATEQTKSGRTFETDPNDDLPPELR